MVLPVEHRDGDKHASTNARAHYPRADARSLEFSGSDLERIHGTGERIMIENYTEIIHFYIQRSYGVICWYGPKPIAPRIQSSGLAFGPSASRALRQPR